MSLQYIGFSSLKPIDHYSLYPNPNSGIFTLTNLSKKEIGGKVIVFDVLGKIIIEESLQGKANVEININENNKGVYFVKLINEKKQLIYVAKTIIQ